MILHEYQHGDTSALDLMERGIIGAVLLTPGWLDEVGLLNPQDFRQRALGQAFEVLRDLPTVRRARSFNHLVLANELEKRRIPKPASSPGWLSALHSCDDFAPCDLVELGLFAREVKKAAAGRRAGVIASDERPDRPYEAPVLVAGPCARCSDCPACRERESAKTREVLAFDVDAAMEEVL